METGTGAVVEEILDELKELRRRLAGDPALDETSVLEAHKWIFSMLRTGLDTQVWSDTGRPRFTDIVGPYHKWGGDNADAFYCYAPLDPARRYRVSGRRGDAVYFSLTVYGGPDDGRYSERIVASVNDRELDVAEDGSFEVMLGPQEKTRLEPDAVCVITRDYVADPQHDRRTEWHIECLDPPAEPRRDTDADLARRFRAALTWLREQSRMVLPLEDDNRVDEPYPVPTETFGWAAGDAAYAMGVFALGDDEALVIEGRSPDCAFWNLCLWNPFLHTYDYDQERVTINGHQIVYEPDGSWRIVIAAADPGHPNWISTAGHPRGRLWFRWFLPEHTPERLGTRVVRLSDMSL
ncbi:DUF1214 domain-containing protein [Actinomadura barringtoniae]|uniref:DUF1214 domain-containing protein n=1 Tax=Actinomadura barringtoniae TaxID=1427535 RepID=A0A939PL74_9ACTN|nr:DUF1214 domain-containing protein [Actinomadura barringtoniae]MBO2454992.1 DUF1214 domain-containing protein [Actinomadura barringtoniae]